MEKFSGSASRIATSPTARATRRISWARTASIPMMRNSTVGPTTTVAATAAWRAVKPRAKPLRSPPDWFQANARSAPAQASVATMATR